MNELLELKTRRKIYNFISKNPGLHLSKIAELLKMRISLVEYHLLFLEKKKIVTLVKEFGYVRCYPCGREEIGSADKKILSLIRQEIPLKIEGHTVHWDGRDESGWLIASGMYFYRIVTKPTTPGRQFWTDVKKMLLMK